MTHNPNLSFVSSCSITHPRPRLMPPTHWMIWCGFWGQSRSSGVNSHTCFSAAIQVKHYFSVFTNTLDTCSTVFFQRAWSTAKKPYHGSLAICQTSFFLSFSHSDLLLCYQTSFLQWLWLSVSLFRNDRFLSGDHRTDNCVTPLLAQWYLWQLLP